MVCPFHDGKITLQDEYREVGRVRNLLRTILIYEHCCYRLA